MIFGVQAATTQNTETQTVSLTPKLMKLLQEAMKTAGIDSSELKSTDEATNFRKLFGGMAETAAAPETPAAAQATFAPKYKAARGFDINGNSWKMNENYFADQDTANWVAGKYGTGEVRETDMLGPGPFGVDTKMFEIKLDDGRWINAGMLAAYYDRNPESLFPGVADKLIRDVLNQG